MNQEGPFGATAHPERVPRSRWRRRVVVAGASLLVLGVGALAFLRSPFFAAEHISVVGGTRLTPARVLRIGGVAQGQNVVTLDTTSIERRLEADPWIASASVATELPDTVIVRITERVPVATVETHLGWEVVAADGVVVDTTAREPHLPAITSVVPGEDITTLAARALAAMDRTLRADVSSLTVGIDGLCRLVLADGVAVSYGALDDVTSKAQALAAVLAWADEGGAHVEQIDVSVPGAPTARLAGGALATP
jgi:cell division protein FtsQ